MSAINEMIPFEFLPWLVAIVMDVLLGHSVFLALADKAFGSLPWSLILLLLAVFGITASREIRRDPRRIATVMIASAMFVVGLFILFTEDFVWRFPFTEHPPQWYALFNAPTEEDRAHSLLMLLLGIGLLLSGARSVNSQNSFCSWIISRGSQIFKRD